MPRSNMDMTMKYALLNYDRMTLPMMTVFCFSLLLLMALPVSPEDVITTNGTTQLCNVVMSEFGMMTGLGELQTMPGRRAAV